MAPQTRFSKCLAKVSIGKDRKVKDEPPKGGSHTGVAAEPSIPSDIRGYPFTFSSPLSPAKVTKILNCDKWLVSRPLSDVCRYDGAHLSGISSTCGDRHIHEKFPSLTGSGAEQKDWIAFGIFNRHNGARTAQALKEHLLPYVRHELTKKAFESNALTDDDIHNGIELAFCALDNAFVGEAGRIIDSNLPWSEKMVSLDYASSGSTALLALYDPSSRKLHVTCTGNSCAILGRLSDDRKQWDVVSLSVDQDMFNSGERERIQAEHCGEKLHKLVKNNRYLDLEVTRAFGDGHWKWPLRIKERAKRCINTDTGERLFKSPPYLTAKPVVSTTAIEKEDMPS